MPVTDSKLKLTQKQSNRLEQLPNAKVVGWHAGLRGPILKFDTGASYVVTRDGGLQKA